MRTSLISLCLAVLAVMAFAASPDDKPKPSDGDMASVANRRGWPETDEMVAGRLAIQDHGMQQGAHVLLAIVELKNRSGHALEMEFDPHDLRIEMFNCDGGRIEEAAHVRSGPVPMSHRMTISADAYAGLPTHRGGKQLRSGWLTRSGPRVELGMLTLPVDSSCRVSLECRNWGMGGIAMVATDSGAWHITKEEQGNVFLRATLTGDKGKPERKTWHGELRTPLIPVTWGDGDQPIH